jgi:hypothetical protein
MVPMFTSGVAVFTTVSRSPGGAGAVRRPHPMRRIILFSCLPQAKKSNLNKLKR